MKNRELIKELLNYNLDAEVILEVKNVHGDYVYIYSDTNSVGSNSVEEVVISELVE